MSAGLVRVAIAAKPTVCTDCLVPEELMVQLVADALRPGHPELAEVHIVREGW